MRKLWAISLSLFLLLGSSGLTYGQHFCGGHVVTKTLMVGERMLGCVEDESEQEGYLSHKSEKPGCCEDLFLQVDTDEQYTFPADSFSKEYDYSIQGVLTPYSYLVFTIRSYDEMVFQHYSPPPLSSDLLVLYQTFQI